MVDWKGRRKSRNVIDARGQRAPARGRGIKIGGGLGTTGIIIAIVMFLMGADPMQIISLLMGGGGGGPVVQVPSSSDGSPAGGGPTVNDEAAEFMKVVLADTEETWGRLFREAGSRYPEPQLVLFTHSYPTACGQGSAASGPFYCPGDRKLYLDLSFFSELERLGAPGDFAQAYVIGHEVGHHIQTVTGTIGKAQNMKARMRQTDANAIQVLVELQADCYAGVWAHYAENRRDLLEAGDVEEGLRAASAIGDDTLQRRAGRPVRKESFTHGSSRERMQWFRTGFDTGDVARCDTFAASGVQLR